MLAVDLGIDNAQLDAGIRQASEFEQSKRLAEDIKQSLQTLKSIDMAMKLLGKNLVELEQDADCLSADLNDKVAPVAERAYHCNLKGLPTICVHVASKTLMRAWQSLASAR